MRRRVCRPPLPAMPGPGPEALPLLPDEAPASPSSRRFLALHLPLLATDRIRRGEATAAPLATWNRQNNRRLLAAVCRDAAQQGLRPGQTVADAQSLLPALLLFPDDPEADAALLRRLALWGLCFTPLAAADPPDSLLLDITGCAGLLGDEAALLDAAAGRLETFGFAVLAAIAGTPDAAGALARAGQHGRVVSPGGEASALAPLPLDALRVSAATVTALHQLGLRRIGDLLQLDRAALHRRFGLAAPDPRRFHARSSDLHATDEPPLLDLLDAALGLRPRPIRPIRPPPEFAAAQDFLDPIVTRAGIDAVLERLLHALCRQLEEAGRGARQVTLRTFRVDGAVQELGIGTGRPQRDPAHLFRLFREKLERLSPGFGFERIALAAHRTDAAPGRQATLPGHPGEAAADVLAQLFDRLEQRLALWHLAPQPSHWPERAVVAVSPLAEIAPLPGWAARPRPVRLLPRPVAVDVIAELPDAPPRLLIWAAERHRIRAAEGPERIAPEWWHDDPRRRFRDYYRLELESGLRLWVCRVGFNEAGKRARWFLHGFLP